METYLWMLSFYLSFDPFSFSSYRRLNPSLIKIIVLMLKFGELTI